MQERLHLCRRRLSVSLGGSQGMWECRQMDKVLRTYIRKEQNMRTNAAWGSIRVSLLSTVYISLTCTYILLSCRKPIICCNILCFLPSGAQLLGNERRHLEQKINICKMHRKMLGEQNKGCQINAIVYCDYVIMIVRREHYLPNEPLKIYCMGLAVLFFSANKFTFISE